LERPCVLSESPYPGQIELLESLQGFVAENLSLLLQPNEAWQPSDYLPDFNGEDWHDPLKQLRKEAGPLSDPVLVVLVADMVTEESLPNYAVSLNLLARDYHGTESTPWAKWARGWTAEENRHGDLLNAYLRLTGRVDMRAVEVTVHHLLSEGFDARAFPDLYGGLVYTSFQERATRISHANVGTLALNEGSESLARICKRIAGDEARHETFYTRVMGKVFDLDPNASMMTFGAMLRRVIAMPGRLMTDGKDPDLFEHFAVVAQRLGVYTAMDYASIVEHLVATWDVPSRSVSGRAAAMQDFLCKHAERCRSMADRVTESLAKQPPIPFSWIHGRTA
jgi:acyl-[acyl-carrier-protein] desaturase